MANKSAHNSKKMLEKIFKNDSFNEDRFSRANFVLFATVFAALAGYLIFRSFAAPTFIFDGRNFGTPGNECQLPEWCNVTNPKFADIAPWSYIQDDKANNTGNFYRIVSSPARAPGRETAEIHLVPTPAGSSERVQFRASQIGAPGVTGKDYWIAASYLFRPNEVYTPYTNIIDVGTKFNTNCSGSASQGGGNGAGVPEFYLHNTEAAPVPANSQNWTWTVKMAGGTGVQGTAYNCNFRYYQLPMHTIQTNTWYDILWHFKYSAVDGQALTEFSYRIGPTSPWVLGFTDTKPNLVRTTQYDAAIDLHYGHYKGDESINVTTGLDLGGVVVASTRADAESIFGSASTSPPPPPASDTTAPTVSVSAPTGGATVSGPSVAVSANASDNVGVSGVQFKLDGASLGSEDTSSPYSINWDTTAATNGNHTLTAIARDAAGNSTTSSSITVNVSNSVSTPPSPPPSSGSTISIWSSSTVPAIASQADSQAVEVGLKFRSDVSGKVTGVRFYKGSTNIGTHVGHLWSVTGTLLGTVTFSGETASGWQQANFSSPIAISANTTYVVSYYAPSGHYSLNTNYLTSAGFDNNPLHALKDGTDGGNGLYKYGASSFPTSSFGGNNYWVDIAFSPDTSSAKIGDLNIDNAVDILDLSIMLSKFNTSDTTCDLNVDGTVNIFDLSILLSHYGT